MTLKINSGDLVGFDLACAKFKSGCKDAKKELRAGKVEGKKSVDLANWSKTLFELKDNFTFELKPQIYQNSLHNQN